MKARRESLTDTLAPHNMDPSRKKKASHGIELQTGAVMGELFDAIGFEVGDEGSYNLVSEHAETNGEQSQAGHDACTLSGRCWKLGGGIEVWSVIYEGGSELYTADCRPAFRSRFVSVLEPWELIEYDEDGEAVLCGSLGSCTDVVLELQNLTEINPRLFREPRLLIGLAGLAYSDSVQLHTPNGWKTAGMGYRFELAEQSGNEACENDYEICGRVLAWRSLRNPVTSGELVWMYVDVSALRLEILANRRALRSRVRVGSLISANVWLQGHILSDTDVNARYEGVDHDFELSDFWAGLRREN